MAKKSGDGYVAWSASLSDWKTVPLDMYKFFHDCGEKRLTEVIADGEKITARSYAVIGFMIPVASISFVEILKQTGDIMTDLSIGTFIAALFILITLIININVRDSWRLGTEPKDIVIETFTHAKNLLVDGERLKALYLSEIEQIQHKITKNQSVNDQRILRFKICLYFSIDCLLITVSCVFIRYII